MDNSIEVIFKKLGGTFLTESVILIEKLNKIEGLLFDWDGVFNNGTKTKEYSSSYSETDSVGINMLRFAYWLKNNKIPYTAIISGQNNSTAIEFAKREHFDDIFCSLKDKTQTLSYIEKNYGLLPSKLCYVFDDIIDISLANKCLVSFLVKKNSNPLFINYIFKNKYADYITSNSGDSNAIREICELIMGCLNLYEKVLENRIHYSDIYIKYLYERNNILTKVHNY